MKDMRIIAKNIRTIRKAKKMTQEELADLAHISVRMIGKIESGLANPSILVLCRICLALEVGLDDVTEFERIRKERRDDRVGGSD